jgi:hypothetical protein
MIVLQEASVTVEEVEIEHPAEVVKLSFEAHPDVPLHFTVHSYVVLAFNPVRIWGDVTLDCPELDGSQEELPSSLNLNL